MKLSEFKEILEVLDLPITYHHWKKGQVPRLPYLVYYRSQSAGLKADDQNYYKANLVVLELYSNEKDLKTEEEIESLLDEYHIPYDAYEQWIDSEKMYEVLYEIII